MGRFAISLPFSNKISASTLRDWWSWRSRLKLLWEWTTVTANIRDSRTCKRGGVTYGYKVVSDLWGGPLKNFFQGSWSNCSASCHWQFSANIPSDISFNHFFSKMFSNFTEQSSCKAVPIWGQLMSGNWFLNRWSRCRQRRLHRIQLPKSFTTNLLNRTRLLYCLPTGRLSTATCSSCEQPYASVVVKRKSNHSRVPFIPQNNFCSFRLPWKSFQFLFWFFTNTCYLNSAFTSGHDMIPSPQLLLFSKISK